MYNSTMAATANPITFISQARTELAKVVWPTRAETVRLTAVVIGISAVVGIIIAGLDVIFIQLMQIILKR